MVAKKKQVENLLSWLPGKSSDFLLEVETVAEFCYDRYVHWKTQRRNFAPISWQIDTTASQRSGHNDPSKYCFKIPAHNDRYVSLTSYLSLSNLLKMTCSNPIWIPVWSGQVTRLFCTIHSINLFLTDTVSSPSFLPLQTTNYKIKGKRRKGEREKGKKKMEKRKKRKDFFVCLFVLS